MVLTMNSILKITAIVFLLISTTNFLYARKCESPGDLEAD
jgi:hypothetical protein